MLTIGAIAPRGPSFAKKMLSGVVIRWTKYEYGMTATNASETAAWNSQTERWVARSAPSDMPAASIPCARNQPTGDHAAHAGRTAARRHASMTNPVTLMTRSRDRKSTRLNSSHLVISYAVFCLKKKKKKKSKPTATAHVKE